MKNQDISMHAFPVESDSEHVQRIALNVNDAQYCLPLDPRVTLLDALREQIGLIGTKKGCDHGQCGACTLLVDWWARNQGELVMSWCQAPSRFVAW